MLPIDKKTVTRSLAEFEKRLDVESCTFHYYYFVSKYYLSDGKDVEHWCLVAIDYFESLPFQHSAYESVFKKYIIEYYRQHGEVERAIAMVTLFISKIGYGDGIWMRYIFIYTELLLESKQFDLALQKYQEVLALPLYRELPEDKKMRWDTIKQIIDQSIKVDKRQY